MQIFFVLGADRVGKSTFVDNLLSCLINENKYFRKYHFSGPQPQHNSPIDQYILPLESGFETGEEFHICDRGGSEVCFYEKYRRGVDIDVSWAQSFESWCLSKYDKVYTILLQREWDDAIKQRHLNEIHMIYEDSTAWFAEQQLLNRKAEHISYYEYMNNYFDNGLTLLNSSSIFKMKENSLQDVKQFLRELRVI